MLTRVFNLGQQEVVDDFDDHRGADLGEREVTRCQQRFVIDGIKGVVGEARKWGFAVTADDDYGCAAVASRFCHAIQTARLAGV